MNVPQLRFSGFDGKWENFELKKLVKLEGGATPLKSEKRYWQDGHIPWVSSQEVGSKKLDKTTFNITEAAVSETSTKMVDKDTLLLVVRSGILVRKIPLSITSVPMAINQDIKAMIIKDKKLRPLFLYQWMKKNEKAMLSNVVKGGTTVQSVNTPDLQDYLIGIPSINEQNKIAEFFELIDEKIEKLQEKIEKLQQFKKGMMQKIFSQELRFKDEDGGEFSEWEEKKVRDIFEITRGTVIAKPSINEIKSSTHPYPVYSSQTKNKGILGWASTYDFEGDFLTWTTDGANAGRVFSRDGKFRCTNVCGVLVEKKETKGYANLLLAEILNLETPKHVSYVGNPKLMNGVMGNITIKIPSVEEQQKIHMALTSFDFKIEKEKEKLMVLEEQKKGFMQGMFI